MAAPTLPEQMSSFQPFQGFLIKKKAVELIQNLCPNHQHVPNLVKLRAVLDLSTFIFCVSRLERW